MRHWKRVLALGLGLTLTFGQAAYGEIIIPPIPTTGIAGTAGAEAPAGTAAAPVAPGQAAQAPAQTGAGLASGVGAGTVSGAGPATSQAPAVGQTSSSDQSQASSAEPVVVAEGVVLMDGSSGKVLYGKNEDQQFYPASITKIMTALVVLERCKLSDVVTFTASATSNLESGAVSLNITEGDKLTVEQCLYGLLLKSANEIGNGLAEHVAGSVSAFADLMNAKAAELGCRNTHFANPHGLNDSTHKTTPYDMALIMRAALQNATFRKIDTTTSYNFPATKKAAARTITMGHKMMYPTDSRYYEGIIGGKTGYTSKAGNTLVTAVEKNGVRLIAVVMKASGTQYTDTKALLDYGFGNYASLTGGESGMGPSAGSGGFGAGPGVGSGTGSGAAIGTAAAAPAATKSASEPAGGQADTMRSGWNRNGNSWYYIKNDGTQAANEWQTVDGEDYWFDGSGYMATGWRKFTNGDWYYFAPDSGHMVKSSWVEDGGAWYYLGKDGVLLTNTTTPDGYPVDGNGIWIQG